MSSGFPTSSSTNEQIRLKNIAVLGTPCRFTLPNTLGRMPSREFWKSPRAQPIIAFSTESRSAEISESPTNQRQNSLAPKSFCV